MTGNGGCVYSGVEEEGDALLMRDSGRHDHPKRSNAVRLASVVAAVCVTALCVGAWARARHPHEEGSFPIPVAWHDVVVLDTLSDTANKTDGNHAEGNSTLDDLIAHADYDCIVQLYPTVEPQEGNLSWSITSLNHCGECHGKETMQMRNKETSLNVVTKPKAQVRLYEDSMCSDDGVGFNVDVPKHALETLFTMVGIKLLPEYNKGISSFRCVCHNSASSGDD